jgi:hypothetical protein
MYLSDVFFLKEKLKLSKNIILELFCRPVMHFTIVLCILSWKKYQNREIWSGTPKRKFRLKIVNFEFDCCNMAF